jgi:hypothetical protein
MSGILSQRLASGVGAGNVLGIEEWGTAFWKIVRKASTVDKAARVGEANAPANVVQKGQEM